MGRRVLFRVDSSSTIGTGHIMRDLVLAKRDFAKDAVIFAAMDLPGNINHKIEEAGYAVELLDTDSMEELIALMERLQIDVLVVDHYGVSYENEKQIKSHFPHLTLMVLDDTYEKHYCDILLNHNIYADATVYREKSLVPSDTLLQCGEAYTLLREEFISAKRARKHAPKKPPERIFVAMGGTDVAGLNPRIIEVLEKFENIKVTMVTTSANHNLASLQAYIEDKRWVSLHVDAHNIAELMAQSDLAIVTPSVTMNEVWYMELPFIGIKVAENQQYMVSFLQKQYPQYVLEKHDEQKLFNILQIMIKPTIKLKNFISLEYSEREMILTWRNDEKIRKWMHQKEKISIQEHMSYVNSLGKRKDRIYFLVYENTIPIGVIDFTSINREDRSAEIGLYAAPDLKGKGKILMTKLIRYGFEELKLNRLIATVYKENKKAIDLYKKFNFKMYKSDDNLYFMELTDENR